MPGRNPQIDAYIAKSADFAKPILIHLRKLAHAACPEVEEALKWGMPHFLHKGILFGTAAFKHHCMLHFWKGDLILDKNARKTREGGTWQFGRVTALSDLPGDRVLTSYIKKAAELNQAGVKKTVPGRQSARTPRKEVRVPVEFAAALKKNKKARDAFEKFSYSHKKEYVQWIAEAKRDETRQRRIVTAIEWLAKGKARNWKYMK